MCHKRNHEASTSSVPDGTAATSVPSTASSPAPEHQPQTKKAKFEERYKTEESSDADVLGETQTI
jgi:hypothetical protein